MKAYGSVSEEDLNKALISAFNNVPYPRVCVVSPLYYSYIKAAESNDHDELRRISFLIDIKNRKNLTDLYLDAKKTLDRDAYRAFCVLKAMWGLDKNFSSSKFRYEWSVFSHWDEKSDLTTGTNLVLTREGFKLVTYEEWGMYYAELETQEITLKQALQL